MRTVPPERIQKVVLYKKVLIATRAAPGRHTYTKHGIDGHVDQHQPGNILAIVQQLGNAKHIERKRQKTHHQATARPFDLQQLATILLLFGRVHLLLYLRNAAVR